jgi:tetratricopeptide (TPR) repeat protein
MGRHADAVRALAAPLAAHPEDVRLVVTRASVLERQGRVAEAIAELRAARDARERAGARAAAIELTAALADALVRADRAQEAIGVLRASLAASPRDVDLLYALGTAYDRAGQRDAAVAEMRALLALEPEHAEALNFVGYALAEQGVRLDEAEQLVRRALELRPRSGHVLDSLGWVLFRRGDAARAVEILERADALAGPEPTILEHLGDAYRALARRADAARVYQRALGAVSEDDAPSDEARRRSTIERKLRELSAGDALRRFP